MLFELCTGQSLFKQDTANDEIVTEGDWKRLCLWHTISDEKLELVFSNLPSNSCFDQDQTISDAKNLIRSTAHAPSYILG